VQSVSKRAKQCSGGWVISRYSLLYVAGQTTASIAIVACILSFVRLCTDEFATVCVPDARQLSLLQRR
jgi:hypothetical protein